MAAAKAAGARGGTITFGRTTGDNALLRALSLADVHQDIMFTLMGPEAQDVLAAIVKEAAEHPKKLSGYAAVIDVPAMMLRRPGDKNSEDVRMPDHRSDTMDSGYDLITIITNAGYGDDVMAAARKAGARGGTILNARGTGTAEDVKFFGITLVPEKEMLLIVVDREQTEGIIQALTSVPKLNEPGGGIVYTQKVEQFMVLGQ